MNLLEEYFKAFWRENQSRLLGLSREEVALIAMKEGIEFGMAPYQSSKKSEPCRHLHKESCPSDICICTMDACRHYDPAT